MHIFVKIHSNRTITLKVAATDTVGSIKAKIEARVSIPQAQQLLLYAGDELDDTRTLWSYHIHNVCTIHCATRSTPEQLAMQRLTQQLQSTESARTQWSDVATQLGWRPSPTPEQLTIQRLAQQLQSTESARVQWSNVAIQLGWRSSPTPQGSAGATIGPSYQPEQHVENEHLGVEPSHHNEQQMGHNLVPVVAPLEPDEVLSARQKKRRRQNASQAF